MLNATTTMDPTTMGAQDIVDTLGGGIQPGSFVIIEGEVGSGKSILSHHIAHGALISGSSVAYYTTDENYRELMRQMDSMNGQIWHHQAIDRLRVYSVPLDTFAHTYQALEFIIKHISQLPKRFNLVFIDCITPFILTMSPKSKIDVFQAFKEMSGEGPSIVLVAHTHLFEEDILNRTYLMSDYYLRLRTQDDVICSGIVDARSIKTLEIWKLCGAERRGSEVIEFEIKPEVGIQILPFIKVKI